MSATPHESKASGSSVPTYVAWHYTQVEASRLIAHHRLRQCRWKGGQACFQRKSMKHMSFVTMAVVLCVSAALHFLLSLLPSRKAASVSPIEALRRNDAPDGRDRGMDYSMPPHGVNLPSRKGNLHEEHKRPLRLTKTSLPACGTGWRSIPGAVATDRSPTFKARSSVPGAFSSVWT
jgi:hypothetical protein